ncbi:MAG: NAD(+)/NADH kinase [Flavobacteriales bacterium]|nr:NAD(+)/NADH kinase [Flavobacteriales bacterium]
MGVEYAIIIKGRTRLESLIDRFNTRLQAKFYIERSGGNFEDYEQEHDTFHQALDVVQRGLGRVLKNKLVERSFLPAFIFSDDQVVITIGQDGLLANAAKYVGGRPIIGVNPDPSRYDGVLLPYDSGTFLDAVAQVVSGSYETRTAPLAQAALNDGQRLLAFNDLFIGISDHTSARYRISFKGVTEEQSSSGILVSTSAGSTGWLSSVFNMANGIIRSSDGEQRKRRPKKLGAEELFFVVREPFLSQRTKVDLTLGSLNPKVTLQVESLMPDRGVIFSDGIASDHLRFNSGSIATIGLAKEKVRLVVPKD